ncbi:hypothetical protein MOTE_24580 [Moorella thermoacetica]|uniref:Uncharacterized protein n=1 Tax=Neomoorella thermoacetica TaxID=1525 RepID=A0A1J5N870_NEOTH|nr:hypothetical protein MOTE_24580 [Moorella thermoacetica]
MEAAASLNAQTEVEAGYAAPGQKNEVVITVTSATEDLSGTPVNEDVYQQLSKSPSDG